MPKRPIVCASRSRIRLNCRSRRARERSWSARCGCRPIRIGDTKALLLGPLTVEPAFRERGVGQALIERALKEAAASGHKLVILVGDEPYYGKAGFKPVPPGRAIMPGPVDPARLLVAELTAGAFEGVAGAIRPDPIRIRIRV